MCADIDVCSIKGKIASSYESHTCDLYPVLLLVGVVQELCQRKLKVKVSLNRYKCG